MRSDDQRELILICRQLAVMMRAGIPLGKAVSMLSRSDKSSECSPDMRKSLVSIKRSLESGNSFSDSLRTAGNMFPKPLVASVAAGEAGGILQEVLERQSEAISRNYQSREKLKTAMMYPIFLLISASVLIAIMLIIVLPVFANMFQSMNAALPLPTRIILYMAELLQCYIYIIPLILLICVYFYKSIFNSKLNRRKLHQYLLMIPILGRLLHRVDMERWLATLALLLEGGVPLVDGLKISSEVLENSYLQNRISNMERWIKNGSSLSASCIRSGCMDGFILELLTAGELSGELPEMMWQAAGLCQVESDNLLQRIQALAEPTVIMFIGVITGFLVISIMLPIMDLMTLYV